MIDSIQMQKHQRGPMPCPVGNRRLRRRGRALAMLHDIGRACLDQAGESGPIVEYCDAAGGPLSPQETEDGLAAIGCDFELVGLLLVRRHAVLLRSGT